MRWGLGVGLTVNELIWWFYRYSKEGVHPGNLPLQLCDAAVWFVVVACLTGIPAVEDFSYFAGIAGAGMALLTPNPISPWPSDPAVYFFLAHGGIVIAAIVLVAGSRRRLPAMSVWRSFGILLCYALAVGLIDKAFGANFMFLMQEPGAAEAAETGGASIGRGFISLCRLKIGTTGLGCALTKYTSRGTATPARKSRTGSRPKRR